MVLSWFTHFYIIALRTMLIDFAPLAQKNIYHENSFVTILRAPKVHYSLALAAGTWVVHAFYIIALADYAHWFCTFGAKNYCHKNAFGMILQAPKVRYPLALTVGLGYRYGIFTIAPKVRYHKKLLYSNTNSFIQSPLIKNIFQCRLNSRKYKTKSLFL